MAARTAELMGVDHIGLGSDLCQDQPDYVVAWMRNGRWTKDLDYGEGSAKAAGFPKQPDWFACNRDFGNVAEGLQAAGFSTDEAHRAKRKPKGQRRRYPLLEIGYSFLDCQRVIAEHGWPRPLKSSCYFCPFQRSAIWNDMKRRDPDLFQRALDLETNYYTRRPDTRQTVGLLQGRPLWKMATGVQTALDLPDDFSCQSGYCGL